MIIKPWLFQKGHKGYWLGKTFSSDHKRKLSKPLAKHPLWKGGTTSLNHLVRSSLEYRLWREVVFKRDNWTCVECKQWVVD